MLVTDAARLAGLVLNTSCGQKGICGGCAVDLLAGTYKWQGQELSISPGQSQRVLACQTQIVAGEFKIHVPPRSLVETGERIVVDFDLAGTYNLDPTVRKIEVKLSKPTLEDSLGDLDRLKNALDQQHNIKINKVCLAVLRELPAAMDASSYHVVASVARDIHQDTWQLIDVRPVDAQADGPAYGVAVDIGTTTVAVSLVNLSSGKIVDSASCYNQQIQQADDVTARIVFGSTTEGLEKLGKLIVQETINPLIKLLCNKHDILGRDLLRVAVSGNTVMWHLFASLNPAGLGAVPFQPAANAPDSFPAGMLGLAVNPEAPVDIVPSISAYVGGDIVSDINVCKLHKSGQFEMAVDVGTNGEIAISDGKQMLVASCAAGPAFEGVRLSCGTRACTGAIERITIDPDTLACKYQVIAEGKPVGICGSGFIDFLAEALRSKLINHAGRFNQDLLGKVDCLESVKQQGRGIIQYVVARRADSEDHTHDIVITEKDIETILQAKAAVYAAINILLGKLGRTSSQLQKIYLAGGFARYIDVRNAITIGLLPELPRDRYIVVGNGSLAGAFEALVDSSTWQDFERIIRSAKVVELNLEPDFEDQFTFALFLPNMQHELFKQTVQELNL